MPLPSLSGGYRTISRFSNVSTGKPWSTGLDYLEATQSDTLAQQLGDAMILEWEALFAQVLGAGPAVLSSRIHPDVQLEEVEVYALGTGAASYVASGPGTAIGTSVEAPLPPDLAIVASKRTNFRGRSGRGRSYFAGWTENAMDGNGGIATIVADAIDAQYENMRQISTASGTFDMVIITPQTPPPDPDPWVVLARQVTSIIVDTHWDVQRRRGLR